MDGADHFIADASGKPASALVQVKSGHVKVGDLRDLRGLLEREGSPLGLFITLEPPTRDMEAEASAAGFTRPTAGKSYPRLQIITISSLLAGQVPDLPPTHGTFKKAGRIQRKEGEQGSLGISNDFMTIVGATHPVLIGAMVGNAAFLV